MSSCLSSGGGGRAYRLQTLDLDVIKSPSSTSWISNSSSPSSTLSETSNCPLAISTRKPRTPRKRPNQTYNEAAAILSTAYPKIFPTARKFPNSHDHNANNSYSYNYSTTSTNTFMFEPSDQLLMPFQEVDTSRLLLDKPDFPIDVKVFDKPYQLSPPEIDSRGESHSSEEFDAESILDEEIGGGIESIMGNIELENVGFREPQPPANNTFCYGYPVPVGLGLRRESRAVMRSGDHCDWWRFQIPCVNVVDVTPSTGNEGKQKQKKKKMEMKKADAQAEAEAAGSDNSEDSGPQGLLLKLNYDAVLNAWSDKASPFSGDSPPSEAAGNDVRARLAQIDLFSDNGGVREASVLRYKEKRRTRLFSKKIRYQVRKVNADRRPRMKGRFVRTPTSSDD